MRFLFLLMAITQLLAVNAGYGLDLYDAEAWIEGGRKNVRHHGIQPDADQQAIAPANEEEFSLTRMISSGFHHIKLALPIITPIVIRALQEISPGYPLF